MALVTANDVGVLEGTIVRPLVGVWIADLVLDQPDGSGFSPGTKVTIQSEGGYSLSGVVDPNRTGDFLDAVHVRILGGAGGMGKAASTRSYVQPGAFVRDVVNGLVGDAGETLSTSTDQTFLTTNLTAWAVMGKSVSWNLRALLKIVAPSYSWRILADGTLWIGAESWPSASGTFDTLIQNPTDGSYELGIEAPFVSPGTNIDGVGNVNRCVDVISGGRLRTHVYIDLPGEGERGLEASISRIVGQANAGIDYYGTYLCKVVSQSSDLATVDIQPVGARNQQLLGTLQRVPVRMGTAIKEQFVSNETVLLAWDGADPRSPYVFGGLSSGSVQRIQIGGDTDAARKGDPVGHGTLAFTFGAGTGAATLAIVYTPGDGSAAQNLALGSGTITLKEKIVSGSSVVGLG